MGNSSPSLAVNKLPERFRMTLLQGIDLSGSLGMHLNEEDRLKTCPYVLT